MRLMDRIKNLWELSEMEAGKPTDEYKVPGTEVITLVKKPEQSGRFIPRVKEDSIKALVNEPPE